MWVGKAPFFFIPKIRGKRTLSVQRGLRQPWRFRRAVRADSPTDSAQGKPSTGWPRRRVSPPATPVPSGSPRR